MEHLVDGEWRAVCADGFGARAASIACRIAGWAGGIGNLTGPAFGGNPISASNTLQLSSDGACLPTVASFLECSHVLDAVCAAPASVSCEPGAINCWDASATTVAQTPLAAF